MIHHEKSLEIDAHPDTVWAVLSRFMHIDEFAPRVRSVDALTNGEIGIGSKRRCHFKDGTSLVEEVTTWQLNSGYGVQLSEMSALPMNEAHASIVIEPLANERARVTWGMDYRMKFGPVGWVLGQTVIKVMASGILNDNLKALAAKVQKTPATSALTA